MLVATGYFDQRGNPCLKFGLAGVFVDAPGIEFEAIIDTGFSGFLALPIIRAFPLGLPLSGTTSAVLADGSTSTCLTALCKLTVGKITNIGAVMLQAQSSDVLLGMDFLRKFKITLVLTDKVILLMDKEAIDDFQEKAKEALTTTSSSGSTEPPQPS